ncbi:MAG TPA: DUF1707 domain-containing protein [Acidimicrobiales bacterium]|nr:DUF1707 domain-containing protein [Acidimicrobiales bacterium]
MPPAGAVVRASDAERDAAVDRLRLACADGRLTLEEFGTRVGDAYGAVWRGDLERLLADLPAEPSPAGVVDAGGDQPPRAGKAKWLVAVMGSIARRGHWRLPPRTNVIALMSEASLDLRQAVIQSTDIEMTVFSLMSSQTVIVPEGVDVEVTGFALMAGRDVDVVSPPHRPGVPRLHIKAYGLMSEITVTNGRDKKRPAS